MVGGDRDRWTGSLKEKEKGGNRDVSGIQMQARRAQEVGSHAGNGSFK